MKIVDRVLHGAGPHRARPLQHDRRIAGQLRPVGGIPESPVAGVIDAVDSGALVDVRAFTMRVGDGTCSERPPRSP